ncbi:hypothetical protein SB778_03825 [Paraburkholderia sp. SIMBA_050]
MALRIIEALDAYLRAAAGGTETAAECKTAYAELQRARSEMLFADPDLLNEARERYADGSDDNVEIDDGALISEGEGGTWVLAWVWVAGSTSEDDDACRECGEANDNGEGYDGLCGNCADREFGDKANPE